MDDLGFIRAMPAPVCEKPKRHDGRARIEPMGWVDLLPERGVMARPDGENVTLWVGFGGDLSVTTFPFVLSTAAARELACKLNDAANKADGLGHPTISWA